jgi:dCMP deaminase
MITDLPKRKGIKRSKNYIDIKCHYCNKEKSMLKYREGGKNFCNKDCYSNYHKSPKITIKCKYAKCQNSFERYKKEKTKYCSRICYKLDYSEDRQDFNTNSNYRKGYYTSLRDGSKKWFDNRYELSRMKQLDMDKNVLEWTKNKIKIRYTGEDNKEHIYTPDLIIRYKDETIIEEIKERITKIDVLKMESAIPFLKNMNIEYKIIQKNNIYDDYLDPIIEIYENKFGSFQRISLIYSFMKMAKTISDRSTCIRRKVGCLIAPQNLYNISAIGYNGSLPGKENGCISMGSGKCGCIHAEINALSKFKEFNKSETYILFCTLSPCMNCSSEILNYPIKKVIYLEGYRDTSGIRHLKKNGISVIKYQELVDKNNTGYEIPRR